MFTRDGYMHLLKLAGAIPESEPLGITDREWKLILRMNGFPESRKFNHPVTLLNRRLVIIPDTWEAT